MYTTRLIACGLLAAVATVAEPSPARLVLTAHSAEIDILGIVADVVARRTFRYEGDQEASLAFAFPASPAKDLVSVTLSVDSVPAVLSEFVPGTTKRSRSLLAVDRVVPPGGTVTLDVHCTEVLMRADGVYEFVYPTLYGPGLLVAVPAGDSGTGMDISQLLAFDDSLRTTAHITLTGGLPVDEVTCVSHEAESWSWGRGIATVLPKVTTLLDQQRDLVVRYRLAGDDAIPELYTFETPDGELMFMVGEPGRVKLEE